MKNIKYIFISLSFIFFCFDCEKFTVGNYEYAPTDVLVKIKSQYTIDKVFDLINDFDFEVEYILAQKYTSNLPIDSLQYVEDYLNNKTYTTDGKGWTVVGHLYSDAITLSPRLFNMHWLPNQKDWLESIKLLKLEEDTLSDSAGCFIVFHVPEGTEEEWVQEFEELEMVSWSQLNYRNHSQNLVK